MCNVLITAGITDIEPLPGVVLCTCSTGAHLMGMAKSFYSEIGAKAYNDEYLEAFRGSFEKRQYDEESDVSTVVTPLNIRGSH